MAIGFANPLLYWIPAGSFHDVVTSASTIAVATPSGSALATFDTDSSLRAVPGYDDVTGRGSPLVSKLIGAEFWPAACCRRTRRARHRTSRSITPKPASPQRAGRFRQWRCGLAADKPWLRGYEAVGPLRLPRDHGAVLVHPAQMAGRVAGD